MDELKSSGKSFEISKWEVWEAWKKVKANKGAPGVDGCSIEEFEKDLRSNLYKIWNRMSSGSYFPPPVRAVEIPKPHGGGTRILGVPTVADRIAQTVVAARLENEVEPKFHQDSYGYRPGRSALDAVGKCRERCFRTDWVIADHFLAGRGSGEVPFHEVGNAVLLAVALGEAEPPRLRLARIQAQLAHHRPHQLRPGPHAPGHQVCVHAPVPVCPIRFIE